MIFIDSRDTIAREINSGRKEVVFFFYVLAELVLIRFALVKISDRWISPADLGYWFSGAQGNLKFVWPDKSKLKSRDSRFLLY